MSDRDAPMTPLVERLREMGRTPYTTQDEAYDADLHDESADRIASLERVEAAAWKVHGSGHAYGDDKSQVLVSREAMERMAEALAPVLTSASADNVTLSVNADTLVWGDTATNKSGRYPSAQEGHTK